MGKASGNAAGRPDAKWFFMAHAQQLGFNLYKRVGCQQSAALYPSGHKNTRNKAEGRKKIKQTSSPRDAFNARIRSAAFPVSRETERERCISSRSLTPSKRTHHHHNYKHKSTTQQHTKCGSELC